MTNGEKFKEVFGFTPDNDACILPEKVCATVAPTTSCGGCVFQHFFEKDYRPCFVIREDLDDGK